MKYSDAALFSDLDGTLFNSHRQVSERNREAIKRFVQQGGSFGISTGRAPANSRVMLPGVEINSWSVVINGAQAFHFEKGIAANQNCLPKDTMKSVMDWVLAELPEVNIQLCTDNSLFFLSDRRYADKDFVSTHQPLIYSDIASVMTAPWMKVLFCAPRPTLEKLEHHAREVGADQFIDLVYTNTVYLEFLPRHINKGTCLRLLRDEEELRGKTFIAVGDYTNDLELMEEADVAVAMGNALPEVKAIADHVICTNDEDGIAYLIDTLIPSL